MATEVRWRRGTKAQHEDFIGAMSEFTHDTTKDAIRVHNGATPGGNRTLMESELGVAGGISTLDEAGNVPESQLGNLSKTSDFATVASAENATIGAAILYLRTAGYYAPGDGGAALYKRALSEPSHAGKIQSEDGAWWELATEYVTPNMFGAKCNGIDDDVPALNAAWEYATSLGIIGSPINLVSTKVYYAGSSIQLGPISAKQRILEGNGATIKCLASFSGYLFDSDNDAGVWAWLINLRNFTADGIYNADGVNFIRARHVNGLNLDDVYIQSFDLAVNLNSSYAVALRNVTFRYIKKHVLYVSSSSMQLKLIDVRAYSTNDGTGTAANAAIFLQASNANIALIGCDFEGGKSDFLYAADSIRQLSITDSYIEGFVSSPIIFDGPVTAFTFEGNWLGYNVGVQEWRNIKSGRISGNVFAQQQTFVGSGNGDIFDGNNSFIDGSNFFTFRVIGAVMASGATALDMPGYKRTPHGLTCLSGRLSRTASGALFNLPEGYRPKIDTSIATFVEGSFNRARIDITSAGVVSVAFESAAGGVRLDGMSFLS